MIRNVQGTSLADPFWHQEAKDLASQVIRVLRLAEGREPTMASLYRAATSYEAFEEYVKLAEKRERTAEQHEELASIKFWLEAKAAKLDFYDAVLNRLARAEHGSGDVGRGVFFVADEYDGYTTQPGDGDFFSKCREGKCCAVIATQTYESFVAKLRNEHVAAQLLANLRTKIWLCAEDNYTARQAADLCGEIERRKVSHSRNES